MRIAINTRFLLPDKMEGFGWYTYEISKRLVLNHPEHEFFFFFDRPYDKSFVFAENVTPVILRPPARHPFLFITWFEFSVKRALKKYNIDLFFSPDGYLSLGSNIPQVSVIHDLNFVHNPDDLRPLMSWYYNKYFPKFARKASKIITVSEYSRKDIMQQYDIPGEKVKAIWNGVSDVFQPVTNHVKEEIKQKYTGGKDFILFVGSIHPRKNLKRLMLAFEQYRLRNPDTELQLLIVGRELWKNGLEAVSINEQTQRAIHFTGHLSLEELAKVTASGLFMAFVTYFEGFGIPLVEAMRSGTPILAGNQTSLPEVAGNAAIYCDPFSVESISEGIDRLANEPKLREELSALGKERGQLFTWDQAAQKVWEVLESQLTGSRQNV